jgi:hypothetical protein
MKHSPLKVARRATLALVMLVGIVGTSHAQTSTSGWNVGVYPILAWIPTSIDIDLELPPGEGGDVGSIAESRFDGAYLGGFYASKGWFRTDVDVVWAAIGGDRVERPAFTADVDLIYFHATGGVRLAPGFYATGGLRRVALKFDVKVADFPNFERKPGVWDPLVGVAYHYEGEGRPIEFHAAFEAGGFGVGADRDYGGMARLDWKPFRHFGLTAGYSFLRLELSDTVRDREFDTTLSVHGPVAGIGIYF